MYSAIVHTFNRPVVPRSTRVYVPKCIPINLQLNAGLMLAARVISWT